MARKTTRGNDGDGSIRQKTRTNKDGTEVKYWEGRISLGTDPKTGTYMRKTVTAPTKKECSAKMHDIIHQVEHGTYKEAPKRKDEPLTLGKWLDTWQKLYLDSVKSTTAYSYAKNIEVHIKPELGKILLDKLTREDIKAFYNKLSRKGLSVKTVRNIHGTLHKALETAVKNKHIAENPSDEPELAKLGKPEIQYLDSETEYPVFLKAISENRFQKVYFIALFTGMREAEVLGLTWDEISFKDGVINIKHQLQRDRTSGIYSLVVPKNSEPRKIKPMPSVMELLKQRQKEQFAERTEAAEKGIKYATPAGLEGLVFTDETGRNLIAQTIYNNFKAIAKQIDRPELRFHDLRHTYAVTAIENGDDALTISKALGHKEASFTLNVYATVSKKMRDDSASRMERLYQSYAG